MQVQSTKNECSNLEQFILQVFAFIVSSANFTVRNTIKEEPFEVEQLLKCINMGFMFTNCHVRLRKAKGLSW